MHNQKVPRPFTAMVIVLELLVAPVFFLLLSILLHNWESIIFAISACVSVANGVHLLLKENKLRDVERLQDDAP
jgi:hypothetical protein